MTSYASSGSSSSSASSSCATMTSSCSGTSSAPAMAGSEAPDVVGVIKLDHAHVMNLFKEYEGLRGKADTCSNERRECVAYEIVRQISIHSAAEELVVYPAFSERMTDQTAAKKIYDASIADHQHLKESLSQVDQGKVTDADFDLKVDAVRKIFSQHVKEEEEEYLPKFVKSMANDGTVLKELAQKFLAAKEKAPTRPHPSLGTPTGSVGAALCAAIDKMKDSSRFGAYEKGKEKEKEKETATTSNTSACTSTQKCK